MRKNNNIDEKTLNKGKVIRDFEEEFNNKRLSPLSSNTFSNIIKNLSTPRFLGSYHLKEAINPKFKSFEKLLRGDIQLKYSKSLRNIVFNPITIALIIIALGFNLFWLFTILF
ncbi:MAG: hypothetical protein ACXACC_04010 [Promethearchaeota archaeon]|jgi:hypothetical protein